MSSSSSSAAHPTHEQPPQDDAGSIHSDDAEEIYEEEEDDGSRPMDSDSDDDDEAAAGGQDEVVSGSAMDSLRELDGMRVEGDTLVFDPDGDMGGVEEDGQPQEDDEGAYVDNSVMLAAVHKEGSSVFDVALHPFHPSPPLAVSGGEDDSAYLFETSTGRVVTQLTGHTDSVVCVGFSADGEFVASGGMDGRVRVWKRVGKDSYGTWEFLASLEGPDEVTCMTWHPKGSVLVAGGGDSTVWMWQLPSGNTMQVFAGHTDAVSAVAWTPDGKKLMSSSADSTLILWDPRTGSSTLTFRPEDGRFALENGITSLAIHPSSNLAVVGGSEGGIRVVNLIKGEVVAAFQGHKEGESVESVQFIDIAGNGVVVSAGTDGKACVWDVTTGRLRSTLDHQENAITSLHLHLPPQAHMITTSSVDATLKTWDVRNGTLLGEHQGHRSVVNAFAVGGGGDGKSAIVSGGDDGLSFVWVV